MFALIIMLCRRKNAGLENLQVKLNDALDTQEKLQQSLARGVQSAQESPDKTKKLNAVIFNMSEKVEDLRTRLKVSYPMPRCGHV